ncbi:hypothetical protein [Zavarzinella formosa]|uniref:hypothetical protein n=1 Tax=Zavarzinella formosa TaxID=360055 RepID=UPI00030A76BA|nr:hypothetical protein [Zavarzinella formosa]
MDHATSSLGLDILSAPDADTQPADNTFVSVGQIIDENTDEGDTGSIPATHLNQTGVRKRSRPSVTELGMLTYKVHMNGGVFANLKAWKEGRERRWWLVKLPLPDDETHFDLQYAYGFIKSLKRDAPADGGGMTVDVTIECSELNFVEYAP